MKLKIILTLILCITTILGGCTRALVATYKPGMTLSDNGIAGEKIAIYAFEDNRAWIDKKAKKSHSFIAQEGSWKFGLKYDNIDYQPVALVLQDVFIKEFKAVGVDAFKGEGSTTPSFKLTGKILNFEFENEAGFITVTSRRHVSLALTLSDKNGKKILANELFDKVDRENEGLGVMHATNVSKLMDEALKEVVVNVVTRTNAELSLGNNTLSVTLNGAEITPFISSYYAQLAR